MFPRQSHLAWGSAMKVNYNITQKGISQVLRRTNQKRPLGKQWGQITSIFNLSVVEQLE